jgi:hypothetical protein
LFSGIPDRRKSSLRRWTCERKKKQKTNFSRELGELDARWTGLTGDS